MYEVNGFFHLRYQAPEGAQQPNYYACGDEYDPHPKPLQREIYSDSGVGYDAKFVGHDGGFSGAVKESGGGMIYNVHISGNNNYNKGERNYFRYYCASKHFQDFYPIFKEYYKKVNNNPSFFGAVFNKAFLHFVNTNLNKNVQALAFGPSF